MEKDKNEVATTNKLRVRVGGLFITLPIAIILGGMLIILSIILSEQTFPPTETPSNYLLPPLAFMGICLFMFFALIRATLKYTDGVDKLANRLREIQQEQARVERLMTPENQQANDDVAIWLNDESQQQMKKR
jgi:hypothetical protein